MDLGWVDVGERCFEHDTNFSNFIPILEMLFLFLICKEQRSKREKNTDTSESIIYFKTYQIISIEYFPVIFSHLFVILILYSTLASEANRFVITFIRNKVFLFLEILINFSIYI